MVFICTCYFIGRGVLDQLKLRWEFADALFQARNLFRNYSLKNIHTVFLFIQRNLTTGGGWVCASTVDYCGQVTFSCCQLVQ